MRCKALAFLGKLKGNDKENFGFKTEMFHLKSFVPSRDIQIFVVFPLPFQTFQIQKNKSKWNNL